MREENQHNKLNQTFARRIGKTLSDLKQNLLAEELPKHLYRLELLKASEYDKVFLEIGFGMGEHLACQIRSNPNALYIGVEVYINGVANLLKQTKSLGCSNFMIWPDDLDLILHQMPPASLDGIYILFPDPWHKRRHLKKRLFNQSRLDSFKDKLKNDGFVIFASDIKDYFAAVHKLLDTDHNFTIEGNNFSIPHSGYIQTKYHSKAIKEERNTQFVKALLLNSSK